MSEVTVFSLDSSKQSKQDLPHGRGQMTPIINKDSCAAKFIDVHQITLRPSVKTARIHYHKDIENIYIILNGEGEILTGDKAIPIRAGDVVFIPPGAPHEPRNTSKEEMKLIEIKAPPQAEGDFIVVKTLET